VPPARRDPADDPDLAPAPDDCNSDLLSLLADPAWAYRQYDHQLFLNTVVPPGGDGAVLRLKAPGVPTSGQRGLAVTVDGNHRWCALDPRAGTAMVVAEASLNVACTGARPAALVDCLNFGNPEHPEVMWQLSESVDGMAEACRVLDLPVVGGNVSLYNESLGRDIDPTPVVGVVGLIDNLTRVPPPAALIDGADVVVLGSQIGGLGGSRWAFDCIARRGGALPSLDLVAHVDLLELVIDLVAGDIVAGVHDVSVGGIAVTLAEMAIAGRVGADIDGIDSHVQLFGESASRVVLCTNRLDEVVSKANAADVRVFRIGRAGGGALRIGALIDVGVDALIDAAHRGIADALSAGTF
jgi:phosphoribosylformylglycinamidine synthase